MTVLSLHSSFHYDNKSNNRLIVGPAAASGLPQCMLMPDPDVTGGKQHPTTLTAPLHPARHLLLPTRAHQGQEPRCSARGVRTTHTHARVRQVSSPPPEGTFCVQGIPSSVFYFPYAQ